MANALSKKEKILIRQGKRCLFCKRNFSDGLVPTMDHVRKIVNGGTGVAENLRLLCRDCHDVRHDLEHLGRFRSPLRQWVFVWILHLIAAGKVPAWFRDNKTLRKIAYWSDGAGRNYRARRVQP